MNTLEFIQENKVITICRKVYGEDLLRLAAALYEGGVKLIEVTFDQADPDCVEKTAEAIRSLCAAFGDRMMFGAGTVLTREQVKAAAEAGARYIISPNTDASVILFTKELGLVSIPGAMTPSEIITAHNLGADIVKLFPAGELGLGYIKAVRGPLGFIPMSAVGGVQPENVADFLSAGVCGFGVGSPLVVPSAVRSGDDAVILARARAFTGAIAAWEASR